MKGDPSAGWLAAPTWMVDAARLRDTCARLRSALDEARLPPRGLPVEAVLHDSRRIAASLREVLASVDRADLKVVGARSGVVREFRPAAQAVHLRGLFDGLQHGLRQYVSGVLGETKIAAIHRLLRSPAPDVLRILGREDHENSHSDLIAWLLNPRRAPVIALHALRRLTTRLCDPGRWAAALADAVADDCVSVRREVVVGREFTGDDDLCRVDIVISGPAFVLAIENKVWAREHADQTRTYAAWMERCAGLRGGLFLSPSGAAAGSEAFTSVSYLELVDALVDGPSRASITLSEEIVLASYLKTLARGIIPVEMRAVVEVAAAMEAT